MNPALPQSCVQRPNFASATDVADAPGGRRLTFSQGVKAELLTLPPPQALRFDELAMALMTNGRFVSGRLSYALANEAYVRYLRDILSATLSCPVSFSLGKGLHSFLLRDKQSNLLLRRKLDEDYAFDASLGRIASEAANYDEARRRVFLRGLFMSCGSFAEPGKSYHLEFAIKRMSLARFVSDLLETFDLKCGLIKRGGGNIIYLKEGRQLAQILALLGASLSMLDFEEKRVEKEMNNAVNRMVNCDSANARRVADSSARQCERLSRLRGWNGFQSLSPALRKACLNRIENPGLSITELGAMQSPALGKSGMYHRLRRLESLALELESEDEAEQKPTAEMGVSGTETAGGDSTEACRAAGQAPESITGPADTETQE